MRLWIISDLHLEFEWFNVPHPPPDADVCICAGDILNKGIVPSIRWIAENLPRELPVILVAGNHEFYRSVFEDSLKDARLEAARYPNIHFLEDDEVEIGEVRFLGASLWTDFGLYGDTHPAMEAARDGLNDYRMIQMRKDPFERLHPGHTARRHRDSRAFLGRELSRLPDKQTVVITHHAPSLQSVAPEYKFDILTAAFASDMDEFIVIHQPRLWVHGHVHHRVDFTIGKTRVLANPRGYPNEPSFRAFDPRLVVEI
ncbi:metallophosphoesterase [Rhizobium sp. L245/93]|uniref:metallophosphoesterase n=1 Tax=Rhizobium sp. L245/93 TaxID=2819998 RepID=UPI001AD98A15|nr:metallophosphoesterase [Rhizobium sp. L245/93]MBO9170020.1 metallophosphoesterase [Rhizobium sp. L245/93]